MRGAPTLRRCIEIAVLLLLANAAGAQEWTLPSSRCRGLFIVPLSWNGATLDLVLDTGAGFTSIDPDAARRVLGQAPKVGKSLTLRDGSVGELRLKKIRADVHEMDHLALALGRPIDGILGFDTFETFLLTLDYPGSEVRVSKGALPPADGSQILDTIGKRRPFVALDLGRSSVALLIDSGFSKGIDLDPDDPLVWETAPRPTHASARYSEVVVQKTGRLRGRLAIGPLALERPIVRISGGSRLLGAQILEHFVLTFDQRNRRVRMVTSVTEPVVLEPERGTGLALHPRVEGWEVLEVFAGTPAEAAGIRKGDRLISLDGAPVGQRGCMSVDDGRRRTWGFERGGERLEIEIEPVVLVP